MAKNALEVPQDTHIPQTLPPPIVVLDMLGFLILRHITTLLFRFYSDRFSWLGSFVFFKTY